METISVRAEEFECGLRWFATGEEVLSDIAVEWLAPSGGTMVLVATWSRSRIAKAGKLGSRWVSADTLAEAVRRVDSDFTEDDLHSLDRRLSRRIREVSLGIAG